MKCLIIDAVHSAIAEELSKYMQVDTHMLPTQEELLKLIPDYDVLIMRVDPAINKEILDAAKNLKVIGVCSVGLNHIDLDTAKEKGIQVFNAPGLNGNAVAELTLCKMLEMSRHTIPACHDVKVNKTWDKYKFVGRELRGKTLGVLGFGRIGQAEGRIAKALGMNVVAYDLYPNDSGRAVAEYVDLDTLYARADVISLHCNLTSENTGMINKDSIAKMKDGVILINNARGQLIHEQDVADALNSGKMGAAGLDVVYTEPIRADNPLLKAKNCIITPHISWAPKESRQRIMDTAVENVKAYLAGAPINVVNR